MTPLCGRNPLTMSGAGNWKEWRRNKKMMCQRCKKRKAYVYKETGKRGLICAVCALKILNDFAYGKDTKPKRGLKQ